MANFNALFAGCESFMEGDVEINNDVTVPGSEGEALEAESVAEDVGTEGGEIAGEAETEDTKAEAANMVFDQLLNMYQHVKNYGVDRTFLSLYNGNGQLNRMVGYRFPSCESIDSVGSPRSQASRAFLIAMESDGIFSKIWTWIKETAVKVYNFFIKVMDWFREACGNLDMRVGKLWKYFAQSTAKKYDDIKDKSVKYVENSSLTAFDERAKRVRNELKEIGHEIGSGFEAAGADLTGDIAKATQKMSQALTNISNRIKSRSTANSADDNSTNYTGSGESRTKKSEGLNNDTYGRTKDKDDKDGVKALKDYLDRINKDIVDPLADAISDMNLESDSLKEVKSNRFCLLSVTLDPGSGGVIAVTGSTDGTGIEGDDKAGRLATQNGAVCAMLGQCKVILKRLLQQKQAMEMMNLANKQAKQLDVQTSRLEGNGSGDYETHKDAKLSMMGIVKGNSVFARITTLNEKIIAKCCTLAASLQGCVKANGITAAGKKDTEEADH